MLDAVINEFVLILPFTSNVKFGEVVFKPTFPPVVYKFPRVLLLNVEINPFVTR